MDALCPEWVVTSTHFQAPNPKQTPITKIQNSKICLACLREAASAKAGI